MKWKVPSQNDERIIMRFLILPMTANDETRWLEWVGIKQRYDSYRGKWVNKYFIK